MVSQIAVLELVLETGDVFQSLRPKCVYVCLVRVVEKVSCLSVLLYTEAHLETTHLNKDMVSQIFVLEPVLGTLLGLCFGFPDQNHVVVTLTDE